MIVSSPSTRRTHTGMHYIEFLSRFAVAGGARNYFEIGVNIGKSLRRIDLPSIGIDPKFVFRDDVMAGKSELHLYQVTSDDYFSQRRPQDHFPQGVDLAFLDGMHLFEYLLRDFINTERTVSDSGVIFLHDCLPINAEMTERERRPGQRQDVELKSYWTGDVWKIIPILARRRPDLDVRYLDCAPTGLVMIRQLDPGSSTLAEDYDQIIQEWMDVELDEAGLKTFYNGIEVLSAGVVLESVQG